MKLVKFLLFGFICISIGGCQLQLKKTGEGTYTVSGIKTKKAIEKEELAEKKAALQKKLDRADFLLDSLSTERKETVVMHNLLGQMGDKESQIALLKRLERIDKKIEYVKGKKAEIQKQMH